MSGLAATGGLPQGVPTVQQAKVVPGGFAAPASAGRLQAASWRLALEQAQWSSQPAARAATPAAQTSPQTPGSSAQQDAGRPGTAPLPALRLPAIASASAPAQASAGIALSGPAAAASPAPVGPSLPPGWLLHTPFAQPALLPALRTAAAQPAAEAALPHTGPAQAAEWQPWVAQASVQGSEVSASLRDARLDSHQAELLRRMLARQLAASGLRLAMFHVNGRPLG